MLVIIQNNTKIKCSYLITNEEKLNVNFIAFELNFFTNIIKLKQVNENASATILSNHNIFI